MLCANPINPPDWDLTYSPYIYAGDQVSLQFTIKASKDLPTKPIMR